MLYFQYMVDATNNEIGPVLNDREAKIAYLKRSKETRRKDTVEIAKIIVAQPDSDTGDDNMIKVWQNDPPERQIDWFYVNGQVDWKSADNDFGQSTIDLGKVSSLSTEQLDRLVETCKTQDLSRANANALGMVAIDKYIGEGDYETALMVLSARRDLVLLPEVTDKLTSWIMSRSKKLDFLTDFIPGLMRCEKYGGVDLLAVYNESRNPLNTTPVVLNAESISRFHHLGEMMLAYQKASTDNGNAWVKVSAVQENFITQRIKDEVEYPGRENGSSYQGFRSIWNKINTVGPEELTPVEKMTAVCQNEWFDGLTDPDTRRGVIDLLTTSTLVGLKNIENSGTANENHLKVLGEALAIVLHYAEPVVAEEINVVIENFGTKKPGLIDSLKESVAGSTKKIENKVIEKVRLAQEVSDAKIKEDNERRTREEVDRKQKKTAERIKLANELTETGEQGLKNIVSGDTEGHSGENEIAMAKKILLILEVEKNKSMDCLEKNGFFGIGGKVISEGRMRVIGEEIRQITESEEYKKGDLDTVAKLTALKILANWAKDYNSKK